MNVCDRCSAPISPRRRTCSAACKQALYRRRHSERYRAALEVLAEVSARRAA